MGYDLHITRRRQWSDAGRDIEPSEWLAIVEADPGLKDQLEWFDGVITAKSPDPALVERMVAIARTLNAAVQGDDGERYTSADAPPTPYQPSLAERLTAFVRRLRPVRPLDPAPLPPFGVGDTVTDVWHRPATVIAMDPRAEHGMGTITVRYKSGREATFMMRAHHLVPSASNDATERH